MGNLPPIGWAQEPPAGPGKYLPIYRAQTTGSFDVYGINDHITGAFLHVIDERDVPCLGSCLTCDLCKQGRSKRWKAWLPAWEPRYCRVVLLELTADAVRAAGDDLAVNGQSLRGRCLRVFRLGRDGKKPRAKNAPVRVFITEDVMTDDQLPERIDCKAALRRLWGMDRELQ